MKFKAGDKVAVLEATIRGVVVKCKGETVLVEEENGFELWFKAIELVKIEKDQSELSKFSDINNSLFRQKLYETPKPKRSSKLKVKKEADQTAMEVDLHIQNLVKNPKGMSNYDMLTMQIDTAKYKLEFAIRKRIPRVIFIHGVGEGVLQKELAYLFAKYPVKITEASYQKYGLGATEVYILQNK
ncbi:DNA mismatch repair protein MutS [Flavicella sediminum]|uniref:DNA mismatch repair protein MutS n=1 Tax=Flavicella sediminum TaxID=2585141 RepID=UPI001AA096CD|nr:DNA mismatch repair protein MutS [Flavicella sediminum]